MTKAVTPFLYPIRVNWSDCDPANIAYTGRIPYFALESIDAWWEEFTGFEWFRLNLDRNIGTPFVHLSVDFKSPVTPRHKLICEVSLLKAGKRSVRHRVRGFQNDILCFTGEFVSAFIVADSFEPLQPPQDILEKIMPLLVSPDSQP